MPVLIQVRDAHKRYGDQVLLDGAELALVDDVKVGFIGRNGAGKSTLLKVMLGDEEVEKGEVIHHPSLRVGYLRQHNPFLDGESAMDFLTRDSGKPDWKCGEIAGQFELKGEYLFGPVAALSGGWQTRVKLAALLLHDPNLLMLDEPTNFLDLRTQILLEHFLRDFNKAALIVSHDRAFLKATCSQTLELSRGKLTMFSGMIDDFLVFREERREHDRRVNATVASKQKQLQRFIDKNRANASTASQARSKAKQLEKLQTVELESDEPTVYIRPPRCQPRSGTALRCEQLAIGYPATADNPSEDPRGHVIAENISLEIEHGDRVAIVGDNGQGKTTFLRTLVHSLDPCGGSLRWGHGIELGTYAQHVYTSLDERHTVLEHLEYESDSDTTRQELLAMSGALLFRDEHVNKKVKVLSGGERARVCMAGLLLGTANVLILDEPGNHLDVETVEALAEAIQKYKGTVIFTSHDRHFVRRIATRVIEVRDGSAKVYFGDYDSYLETVESEIDEGERQRAAAAGKPAGDSSAASKGKRHQQQGKDQRRTEKEIKNLEKKIARLDDEKKALEKEMLTETDPDKAVKLHEQIEAIRTELQSTEERWMELSDF